MAQALKDSFGAAVPCWIGERLSGTCPGFDPGAFAAECLVGYEDLGLMARAGRIAEVLTRHLPDNPHVAIPMVTACLGPVDPDLTGMATMRYLPLTLYVGRVGLAAFEESMEAQYELTQRFSAEFSIRAFLRHDPQRTLAQLRQWATDPSEHVRRLVSEGTRPRLPWASRLEAFVADPSPVLDLLELLRDDESEYVRRSVANNLNDISKDHPDVVLALAARWWRTGDQRRRRLVRRALRTLVKRGEPVALGILGHAPAPQVQVAEVVVEPARAVIGERVRLTATLVDTRPRSAPAQERPPAADEAPAQERAPAADEAPAPERVPAADDPPAPQRAPVFDVVVDFIVHFVKADGTVAPRVFKGGRRVLGPGERVTVTRSIRVAQLSTRTHHPGEHRVEVQVNGARSPAPSFHLLAADGSTSNPTA